MPTLTTPITLINPTGERCADCHAKYFFAPGYLYSNDDGTKSFTVFRTAEHSAGCGSFYLEDDED